MPEQAVILLAEDSEDDILLVRKAFARAFINNPLHVVRSGAEVVAYLTGEGKYSNRDEFPLPDLMLLDLNMPVMDGFEVLKWLRQQPSLKSLRVIVLTASAHIRDVNIAYQLGANSFLVKPLDFENFVQMSQFLSGYWLKLDRTPQTSRPPRKRSLENN